MAVDTLEEDSVTVEGHDSVLDAEATESDALAGGFYGLAVVEQIHRQSVERGRFSRPGSDTFKGVGGDAHGCVFGGDGTRPDDLGAVKDAGLQGVRLDFFTVEGDESIQVCFTGGCVVVCFNGEGGDADCGAGYQVHGAEEAAETPRVLAFQP